MTSRERMRKALNHEQPDRVPIDLGSTSVTGISIYALQKLIRGLGLPDRLLKLHEPFQMLGLVDFDVLKAVGADTVGLFSPIAKFGYRNENWKQWTTPLGQDVLVGGGFEATVDERGDTYAYPMGDRTARPSGRLPKGGYYFDGIVRQEPIDEDHLDGRGDFAEQFKRFSDEDLRYFEEQSRQLYEGTDFALVGMFGGGGIGDVAHLPGNALKFTPGIRSVEDWYVAHLLHPEYIKDVYDLQIETALENLKLYKQAVGDRLEAIFVSGTDFGTQRSEFIAPDMFREFYLPRFKQVTDWIHANTKWKTFFHSCGSIVKLLDMFVESGVDILNPVQCSATGMDARFLKDKYGDRLVFWGGGVDTQQTLPFGTPEEVRAEATERLELFSPGGGYVFNAIHNIQAPTPVENMLAFFSAAREFNPERE